MTVQQMLDKAVALIDDSANRSDYNTGYLPHVTSIVADCINEQIGITTKVHMTTADGNSLEMPVDLTEEDQILGIRLYDTAQKYTLPTELIGNRLYVHTPTGYSGRVEVTYNIPAPEFVSRSDIVPLSSAAINAVAIYGLAALLATANNPSMFNMLEAKYQEQKMAWKPRKKERATQVVDVYSY